MVPIQKTGVLLTIKPAIRGEPADVFADTKALFLKDSARSEAAF